MSTFTLRALVDAPIDTVFAVLTEHRRYAEFTPLRSATLEREGVPAPNGVGAIRALRLAGPPLREEVTLYEEPTRFGYRLLSGAPVREHFANVELMQEAGGTRIVYAVTTVPRIPSVLAPAAVGLTRVIIGQLLSSIRKHSEELARAAR